MYRHICVPVDNSEHANGAIDLAVLLGRTFGARPVVVRSARRRTHGG